MQGVSLEDIGEGLETIFDFFKDINGLSFRRAELTRAMFSKFKSCLPKLKEHVTSTLLPGCAAGSSGVCVPQKYCQNKCTEFIDDCLSEEFAIQLRELEKGGDYRARLLSKIGKQNSKNVIVADAVLQTITNCNSARFTRSRMCASTSSSVCSNKPMPTTTLPHVCCMAMTKTCLACAAGISVEAYCAKNPGRFGCTGGPVTTNAPTTTEKPDENECEKIACDFEGCSTSEYFGTMADGASPRNVKAAVAKFGSLIQMAGPMLGISISEKCMGVFTSDLVETMLPRCSDKCKALQSCKSACTDIQQKCLGNGLKGQLEMAMGMGSLVDGYLGQSAPIIKSWIKKLTTCSGDAISSSSTECLSPTYKAPLCEPTVTAGPVSTNAPTTTGAPTTTEITFTIRPSSPDTCKQIKCDFPGCAMPSYRGTIQPGFTTSVVKEAVEKFSRLVKEEGPKVRVTVSDECMKMFATDIVETMLPRCSDKCKPLRSCASSCRKIKTKCITPTISNQVTSALQLGAALDSFLGTRTASILKQWARKITTCEGDSVSASSTECLSLSYKAPMCEPTVTTEAPGSCRSHCQPLDCFGEKVVYVDESDCNDCGKCPVTIGTGLVVTKAPDTNGTGEVVTKAPCADCKKTRETVKQLISKVDTVEKKIDSMTNDIKTVVNKHSQYPVGVVVDDESGVAIGHKETFEHNHIRMLEASLQAAKDHASKTDQMLQANSLRRL